MLKKSELYHLIYKIIQKSKQERKENKENKSENVKNYYHDFLKKRKLIPKSHNCKIKDIMKFFQQLDSYVDLNDIVVAIHEHINNENNQLEIQELKNIQSQKKLKKTLTQPMQSVTSRHERTMEKAERLIRDSYKDGHYLQLNRCSQIVQNLQKGSHQLNNVKYKNNATMPTYHQLINKRYSEGRKYYVPNTALKSRKNSFNDEYEIQSQSLTKQSFYLMLRSTMQFAISHGTTKIFIVIGKLMIVSLCCVSGYLALTTIDYYKTSLYSPVFMTVLFGIVCYPIASAFLSLFEMASNTILMCYSLQLDLMKGTNPKCPTALRNFLRNYVTETSEYSQV